MLYCCLVLLCGYITLKPKQLSDLDEKDRMIINILSIVILVFTCYFSYTKIKIFLFNYKKSRFTAFALLFTLYDLVILNGAFFMVSVVLLGIEIQEISRLIALVTAVCFAVRFQQWMQLIEYLGFWVLLFYQCVVDGLGIIILWVQSMTIFGIPAAFANMTRNDEFDSQANLEEFVDSLAEGRFPEMKPYSDEIKAVLEGITPKMHLVEEDFGFTWITNILYTSILTGFGEFVTLDNMSVNRSFTSLLAFWLWLAGVFLIQIVIMNLIVSVFGETFENYLNKKNVIVKTAKYRVLGDHAIALNRKSPFEEETFCMLVIRPVEDEVNNEEEEIAGKIEKITQATKEQINVLEKRLFQRQVKFKADIKDGLKVMQQNVTRRIDSTDETLAEMKEDTKVTLAEMKANMKVILEAVSCKNNT